MSASQPPGPKSDDVNLFQTYAVQEQSPFNLEKLADKFRYRDTGWSIPEAYIAILLSTAIADGAYGEAEESTIINIVSRSPALRSLPHDVLRQAEQTVRERFAQSHGALQEACQTLPADMCLSVFAHCVDITLADGELRPEEASWLEGLRPMLDIEPDYARRIMEVLLLKARY